VEAQATPLPEAGGFQVSPRAFRRLALAAAAMLLLIVATGATVRLTSSGLGCRHWPGCQAGNPFPERGYHSYIEFGNRVVAFFTIVVTLASGFAGRVRRDAAALGEGASRSRPSAGRWRRRRSVRSPSTSTSTPGSC